MAQQQAIRDYLRSKGLKDEQITYDNGSVMANGKRFMDAAPQADGRTYADSKTLDSAYNNYDTMNQLADLRTRATTPNPDVTGYQQAIKDRLSKPVTPFSYDPNTDQSFQAQKNMIAQDTQRDMNNARVDAGAVGMRGGSLQNNQMAQASARNQERLQTQALPQAMAAAYQKYMGQNQLENQQLGNMLTYSRDLGNQDQSQISNLAQVLGMQNNYNQQQTTNDRNTALDARTAALDAYNQQRNRVQDAQWGVNTYGYGEAKQDPGVFFDQYQGAVPLAVQQIAQQRAMQDKQFGLSERQANASIANMGADNSRANEANVLARDRFNWDKDPNNPNNIYKEASAGKQQSTTQVPAKESADNYSLIVGDLGGQGVTKDQAIRLAQANRDSLSDTDYRKLLDYIEKEF